MRNSAFVAVASVVGEAFLATRNQVPVNVLKEKSQGPAGKCPIDHPFAIGNVASCCASVGAETCGDKDKIPCPWKKCRNFRRDCTRVKKGKCWENYCRWEKTGLFNGVCKPKKNPGTNCSADKECDRSLCERKKDQKEGTCGSAVNDPYLTADAFVGMVEKWSGMPNTHLSQGDAIEYRQHVSKVDGSTVKALFIPFTSKQAAFFGFNVTLETGMVQHPNPETTHASFMELYHEFDGLHEWIQEKTRAFNHITFFGENTGGLMAQLARMKASEFQESQESQESTSKKQFHLTAFMEKSRYLRALPEFFPKNDVLKNDEDVCKYTRIHGMPLVNTWSMKKSFVDINPCAGYEQTFKVKMTDPIKLALVGGTSGVLAAAGLLLAADPSGLTLTIVGGSVGLYAGWKLMWSEGKGKKSDVLFGELPTERKPQAHINSN